ncbi:MAG: site-specific DNA-methyltransferase [Acetobacteraceae bacterium]|nr:site-specific DNA-methyltransferase [Acetobacteraceae bacterium]
MAKAAASDYLVEARAEDAPRALAAIAGRVRLVVTSPPYHNAIAYDSHAVDATANYRTRQTLDYARDYLPMLDRVWEACRTMLAPGGHLAINVGTVLLGGYHYPLPQDIQARLLLGEPGRWVFVRSILWNKVTAGVRRAGTAIKYGLPGYWYPNIMTEHIIVLRKPGPVRAIASDAPAEWWLPVWDLAPVPPRQIAHPAPFPEDLPHRLIRMLTLPGEVVFDPFLGAGSTAKAAFDLERVPAGTDIIAGYVANARRRLSAPSLVRRQQLRIRTIAEAAFVPQRTKSPTRHGAGNRPRARADGVR